MIFVVFITEALFSVLLFSDLWLRCDLCHGLPDREQFIKIIDQLVSFG